MFRLTSAAFDDGQEMAQKYGKKARNVSPPLDWEGAPEGTKSFALSFVDVHPVARDYVHWLVSDISPQLSSLPEGAASNLSAWTELKPYVGPFPPSGNPRLRVHAVRPEHRQAPTTAGCPSRRIQACRSTERFGHRDADREVHEARMRAPSSAMRLRPRQH